MVSAQLNCSLDDALAAMESTAAAADESVWYVAALVLAGELRYGGG
jgi:hypothetical protein